MFSRDAYSWAWSRSIACALKNLNLLEDADYLYKIVLELTRENKLITYLYDLYAKKLIISYEMD